MYWLALVDLLLLQLGVTGCLDTLLRLGWRRFLLVFSPFSVIFFPFPYDPSLLMHFLFCLSLSPFLSLLTSSVFLFLFFFHSISLVSLILFSSLPFPSLRLSLTSLLALFLPFPSISFCSIVLICFFMATLLFTCSLVHGGFLVSGLALSVTLA